ncbi:MAG: sialate O-acetylesterase, partial [Chitinophagaceae bacterium]|nr:sialate O-acetylesterase [Chitinophagaceae bacterium]
MNLRIIVGAFLLCGVLVMPAMAQTSLPDFFSDGMVLQQQTDAPIWGMDKPFAKVKVKASWGKKASTTADARGRWKLSLPTPAPGGPYTVTIVAGNTIELKDVLIGEVWLCSGQSNMQMPVKGNANQPVIGSNEAILNSSNPKIRFYNTARAYSLQPQYNAKGEWKAANPDNTPRFSATAYFFARKINSVLNVPVGIIHSSWGASTIESWMDSVTLSAFPQVTIPAQLPEKNPNQTPMLLYNGMIHPYVGYGMKGVLWYQGESNRENAKDYTALFTAMIGAWRQQWQQGDFPFYFVQIAPFEPGTVNAAYLRQAQLRTMQQVKNTGMVVTLDIGEKNMIHPAEKETVGVRLAYWALAKNYGINNIAFSGPVFKEIVNKANGKLLLQFDYAENGLASFGKPLQGFEVAGDDGQFYPAKAQIVADKPGQLTVWSEQVPNPVQVRYAFTNWAEASLFNTAGLPASSFTTSDR